jgi:hypothetical protein
MLSGLLGVSEWAVILPLAVMCGAALMWLDRRAP